MVVAVSSAIAVMSASIVGGLALAGSEEFIVMTAALGLMSGLVAVVAEEAHLLAALQALLAARRPGLRLGRLCPA